MKKRMCVLLVCVGLLLSACDNPSVTPTSSDVSTSSEAAVQETGLEYNVIIEQEFICINAGGGDNGKIQPQDGCYAVTCENPVGGKWPNIILGYNSYCRDGMEFPQGNCTGGQVIFANGRILPEAAWLPLNEVLPVCAESELAGKIVSAGTNKTQVMINEIENYPLTSGEITHLSTAILARTAELPASSGNATVDYSNTITIPLTPLESGIEAADTYEDDVSTQYTTQTWQQRTQVESESWIGLPGSGSAAYEWTELDEMDPLRLFLVPDSPGEYTTVVFVDGRVVQAFDGKTHLDWRSNQVSKNQQIVAEFDLGVIPDDGQDHVMFAVTLNRTKESEGASDAIKPSRTAVVSRG